MPPFQSRRDIREDLAVQLPAAIAILPDLSLKIFQGCRLSVLIHHPVNIGESAGPRRRRGLESFGNLAFVVELQSSLRFFIKIFVRMGARKREEDIVDKANGRRSAFDVEKNTLNHPVPT